MKKEERKEREGNEEWKRKCEKVRDRAKNRRTRPVACKKQ